MTSRNKARGRRLHDPRRDPAIRQQKTGLDHALRYAGSLIGSIVGPGAGKSATPGMPEIDSSPVTVEKPPDETPQSSAPQRLAREEEQSSDKRSAAMERPSDESRSVTEQPQEPVRIAAALPGPQAPVETARPEDSQVLPSNERSAGIEPLEPTQAKITEWGVIWRPPPSDPADPVERRSDDPEELPEKGAVPPQESPDPNASSLSWPAPSSPALFVPGGAALDATRLSIIEQLGRPERIRSEPEEPAKTPTDARAAIIEQLGRLLQVGPESEKPPQVMAPHVQVVWPEVLPETVRRFETRADFSAPVSTVAVATPPPPQPVVTVNMVKNAVFANTVDRLILTRALIDFERKGSVQQRITAVKELSSVRHELSTQALTDRLLVDPSPVVRSECLNALAAQGSKRSGPTLEKALQDPAPQVRLSAVRALYRLSGVGSAKALIGMLVDEDEHVRHRAATCLGWLGCIPDLIDLNSFLYHTEARVRAAILSVLPDLAKLKAEPHLPYKLVAKVIDLLDDGSDMVRQKALHLLKVIASDKVPATIPQNNTERISLIARLQCWWNEENVGRPE